MLSGACTDCSPVAALQLRGDGIQSDTGVELPAAAPQGQHQGHRGLPEGGGHVHPDLHGQGERRHLGEVREAEDLAVPGGL